MSSGREGLETEVPRLMPVRPNYRRHTRDKPDSAVSMAPHILSRVLLYLHTRLKNINVSINLWYTVGILICLVYFADLRSSHVKVETNILVRFFIREVRQYYINQIAAAGDAVQLALSPTAGRVSSSSLYHTLHL
jgi:hypothetical protein